MDRSPRQQSGVTSEPVTVDALAARVGLTRAAVRYHCRDPRGRLYGRAWQPYGARGTWLIPADAAAEFVAWKKAQEPAPHTEPAPDTSPRKECLT